MLQRLSKNNVGRGITLVFLLAVGLTSSAGGAPDTEAKYEATARFTRHVPVNPEPAGTSLLVDRVGRMDEMLTFRLAGRRAIEQVIVDLDMTRGFPRTADGDLTTVGYLAYHELMGVLSQSVSVKVEAHEAGETLVAVTVRHADRELAIKTANQLVENYIRRNRAEIDDRLLEQKKFHTQELERYRRKAAELEGAMLKFLVANPDLVGKVRDGELDIMVSSLISYDNNWAQLKKQHASAIRQRDRLQALMKEKSHGDLAIIELAKRQAEVDDLAADIAELEKNKESIGAINQLMLMRRHEYLKLVREHADAIREQQYWHQKHRETTLALVFSMASGDLRLRFVERADLAKPVK